MGRLSSVVCLALALGCYRSHELPSDGPGPRDGGSPDLTTPRVDGGPPPSCGPVSVLDTDEREWPSFADCGPVSASATVARGGAFDQIARESPETCGRAPQIGARRVRVEGGRLALAGDEQVIGGARPAARGLVAAARGAQLFVAAGVEWTAYSDGWGADDAGVLGMVPASVPGCLFRLDAMALVPLPSGWFVPFDYFECDVGGAQVAFYDEDFALLAEPEIRFPGVGDAVPLAGGALVVGKARPGVDTSLTLLDGPGSEAWTRTIPSGGRAVAAARWPSVADGIAIAFVDRPWLRLRIVDVEGSVQYRSDTPLDERILELYEPVSVDVATTDFGLVVVVGFEWGGGRIDAATAILAFDRRARPLMDPSVAADLGGPTPAVSVAGSGPHALVTAFSSTIGRATARTTLVGCSP